MPPMGISGRGTVKTTEIPQCSRLFASPSWCDSSLAMPRRAAPGGAGDGPRDRRPHLLNNPMISAFAKVLKCKLKPTTAADVSGFTSSRSVFTAKTVNR